MSHFNKELTYEEKRELLLDAYRVQERYFDNERIGAIMREVVGVPTDRFVDAVNHLRRCQEWPKGNIAFFIKTFRKSSDKKEITGCGKCAIYVDGVRTGSYFPGLRLYQKSTGTVYDKVGHVEPCTCSSIFTWMNGDKNLPAPGKPAEKDFKRVAGGDVESSVPEGVF